jgi:hypothetical protein
MWPGACASSSPPLVWATGDSRSPIPRRRLRGCYRKYRWSAQLRQHTQGEEQEEQAQEEQEKEQAQEAQEEEEEEKQEGQGWMGQL